MYNPWKPASQKISIEKIAATIQTPDKLQLKLITLINK